MIDELRSNILQVEGATGDVIDDCDDDKGDNEVCGPEILLDSSSKKQLVKLGHTHVDLDPFLRWTSVDLFNVRILVSK